MSAIQVMTLVSLSVFYISYITKMFILKCHGITGNLLGKGDKPKDARKIEKYLITATAVGTFIQFGSAIFSGVLWSFTVSAPIRVIGVALLLCGNLIFILAMLTMGNNWRTGFERGQDTVLVTKGIYKISRNPAFVGFDFLYIGGAIVFSNIVNVVAALTAVILFHIQILGEEKYLLESFGEEYTRYKSMVRRYL